MNWRRTPGRLTSGIVKEKHARRGVYLIFFTLMDSIVFNRLSGESCYLRLVVPKRRHFRDSLIEFLHISVLFFSSYTDSVEKCPISEGAWPKCQHTMMDRVLFTGTSHRRQGTGPQPTL